MVATGEGTSKQEAQTEAAEAAVKLKAGRGQKLIL